MQEAEFENTEAGLAPAGDGWFVVNLADSAASREPSGNAWTTFEGEEKRFPHFGINVQVLPEGVANCLYHRESNQEAMLVLEGTPLLIIEGQERRLKQWDFVYCPPDTTHVFVGPGVVLMAGARLPDEKVHYPVDEVAAKYGASVETPSDVPREAYASVDWPDSTPAPLGWPPLDEKP